mmetsp:Transcript_10193/g.31347  ORF Transcript_10193/g.31347 Transcript_10193/m.31347 type:complete len:461 (+) Transcript_10193:872-2254(+)
MFSQTRQMRTIILTVLCRGRSMRVATTLNTLLDAQRHIVEAVQRTGDTRFTGRAAKGRRSTGRTATDLTLRWRIAGRTELTASGTTALHPGELYASEQQSSAVGIHCRRRSAGEHPHEGVHSSLQRMREAGEPRALCQQLLGRHASAAGGLVDQLLVDVEGEPLVERAREQVVELHRANAVRLADVHRDPECALGVGPVSDARVHQRAAQAPAVAVARSGAQRVEALRPAVPLTVEATQRDAHLVAGARSAGSARVGVGRATRALHTAARIRLRGLMARRAHNAGLSARLQGGQIQLAHARHRLDELVVPLLVAVHTRAQCPADVARTAHSLGHALVRSLEGVLVVRAGDAGGGAQRCVAVCVGGTAFALGGALFGGEETLRTLGTVDRVQGGAVHADVSQEGTIQAVGLARILEVGPAEHVVRRTRKRVGDLTPGTITTSIGRNPKFVDIKVDGIVAVL